MAQQYQNIKTLRFFRMLPSYRLGWVLVRVFFVTAFAIGTIIFARNVSDSGNIILLWTDLLRVAIIFNLLAELNIVFDNVAERILPIPRFMLIRVLSHILLSIIIGVGAIAYFENYLGDLKFFDQPIARLMIVFGLIFVTFIILVALSLRITAKWIDSQKELEELKRTQLKYDYNALQDQLNPHFLFNNLSVLKSMIMYDQKGAIGFIQNFTDVYRYVLQCNEKTTIKLGEELEFIQAYLGLHKERLGEGLEIKVSVQKDLLGKIMPPLSLQLLVENAIKHNIATTDEPLCIEITTDKNQIIVTNKKNLKESSYSTQKGLENLKQRYELLAHQSIEIVDDETLFKVALPLF